MTLTTEKYVLPAWLNIDTFDLSEEDIATVKAVNEELLDVVKQFVVLCRRVQPADEALGEGMKHTPGGDDVHDALFAYSGRKDLWALLGIMQSFAERITGSGGTVDPFFARECEQYGIEVDLEGAK